MILEICNVSSGFLFESEIILFINTKAISMVFPYTVNSLLVYLLIILIPLSCRSQKEGFVNEENMTEIELTKGETFKIELPTHPGTGFGWEIKEEIDTSKLKFIKKEYKELGDEQLDFPGLDSFKFEALKKGECILELWYIRPWKEDNETNPDIKTKKYHIKIEI